MGNIFSFEDPAETAKEDTKSVRSLFANGFSTLEPAKLAALLRHPDMRVRLRAQFALASNAENRALLISATATHEPVTTRLHGVWGLGNLARLKKDTASADALVKLCSDGEGKVRGQAVQALGDAGHKAALSTAISLLSDPAPRTRMLAAIATGKLGTKDQVPALMAIVEDSNDKDEYLRHGAIQGMILIDNPDAVFAFAENKSPAVRRAVVLALRRFNDARIGSFLKDSDLSIAVEAVQAINDEMIEGARGDLAAATHLLGKSTWAVDLRILNAMIRVGGDENVSRLIAVANDTSLSEDARTEALWLIGRYENHPPTDPTTGMFRPIKETRKFSAEIREKIHDALLPLLASTSGNVLVEAMGLAGKFNIKIPQETLMKQLTDPKKPQAVRLAALKEIESAKPDDFTAILMKLSSDPDAKMRETAMLVLGRIAPNDAFGVTTKILSSGSSGDKQLAIALLGTLKHPEAPIVLLKLIQDLVNQPTAIQLDIIEASRKRGGDELLKAIAAYEAGISKDDPLAAFHISREGGNPETGKRIFFNLGAANCAQCHKVGDRGGEAAPNLKGIANRHDSAYILESIVVPSAKLTAGYSPMAVTMKDGSVVAGMFMKETDTELVIQNFESKKEIVCLKSDIKTMPPAMSTMPPMGAILTKAQIRDLVAFLSSLK
jgi:quinoprotein glucose dehydrogenase